MIVSAKAFLFDLNGTIIDDMQYHTDAWYDILNNDLKAGLSHDEVRVQMYGKNEELLIRIFGEGHFPPERMTELSMKKERSYQRAYLPKLALIDGLKEFLYNGKEAGMLMAVGSASIPFNIDFVLKNLQLYEYFPVVISADDVNTSKPNPDTFLQCAAQLNIPPADCLVFEDAPKGVESARNAGMRAFVLTTTHDIEDFAQYGNIIGYANDYTNLVIGN